MNNSELSLAEAAQILAKGKITDCRSVWWSSNYTFLANVIAEDVECLAVYKPMKGESPLWDFPDGTLYLREYASFLVSEDLGWSLVPPTAIRQGPHGVGTLQLFVEVDPEAHYLNFRHEPSPEILRLVAFDYLVNNADRKSGHCLRGRDGKIWAIDNGLTFHTVPKLRTVIWDFQGQPLPDFVRTDLEALAPRLSPSGSLTGQLASLLAEDEIEALRRRLESLLQTGRYPRPGPGRHYPWPIV